MQAAAARIAAGDHKRRVWTSGSALPCPLATPDSAAAAAAAPLFLARFDAAWIYAELTTMLCSFLERQQQYAEACTLLQALLGGSACPARRCACCPSCTAGVFVAVLGCGAAFSAPLWQRGVCTRQEHGARTWVPSVSSAQRAARMLSCTWASNDAVRCCTSQTRGQYWVPPQTCYSAGNSSERMQPVTDVCHKRISPPTTHNDANPDALALPKDMTPPWTQLHHTAVAAGATGGAA